MENLIEVLENECQEYESLLTLSEEKSPVIVRGDLEALARITDREQEAVERIGHLEKERQETFRDIAGVINRDVNNLKLGDLVDMLSQRPGEQKKLAGVHDRLRSAVYAVKRVNDQNRALLTNAMEMVEFEMNMLKTMKTGPETAGYNRGAEAFGMQMGAPASGFDAKQ
ncbi:MAG: flagellar protein FlgN [Lachnospiraceae bacterium]|nr:flagellar protein FlgN [Lachnospiraceae bacterium]